ncbi:MAG: 2-oxoacid:ferredoxin oxidoreductase subunit beta [Actinobacteria bacterium]|nr:2-oxoacid:ferredoxin oxidoreductase subunit beta [Actinomycetota bacterium]MBU1942554.1 2-oxoacid:ferredoxin oxidoreductase subunit beta [Actinomycetota bacterium]MBU2687201.1 2-oxoacid:ferredoxin oxidoreductase subunit beta [Actinomycetota bacterium]
MDASDEFKGQKPAWCPGCGNFGILTAWRRAMADLGLKPHQLTVVSGIGQSGKFPHYTQCNTFNGLHGRTLPVATGIRLANHEMPVAAFAGDGDCYGEGGNHFLHAMRRNINVKLFVHDNQVYGLTKGQASPTSVVGMKTPVQPEGVLSDEMNPVALAVAMDCSFVARGFAGDLDQLAELMKAAMEHRGFSLVDIFQPCVTFNRLNTYQWYRERVRPLEAEYDPGDRVTAWQRALEFEDTIPTGILYRHERPTYEERVAALAAGPLVKQPFDASKLAAAFREFY